MRYFLFLTTVCLSLSSCHNAEKERNDKMDKSIRAALQKEVPTLSINNIKLLELDSLTEMDYLDRIGAPLIEESNIRQSELEQEVIKVNMMQAGLDLNRIADYPETIQNELRKQHNLIETLSGMQQQTIDRLNDIGMRMKRANVTDLYCLEGKFAITHRENSTATTGTDTLNFFFHPDYSIRYPVNDLLH